MKRPHLYLLLALLVLSSSCTASPPEQNSIAPDLAPLRQELDRQLALKNAKAIAPHPPEGDYAAVGNPQLVLDTLNGEPFYWLEWDYRNHGDYDGNGETNASDLGPIAKYLGVTSSSPDWSSASFVDGDGNLEIGLGDIGPIAANYLGQIPFYILMTKQPPNTYFSPSLASITPFPYQPTRGARAGRYHYKLGIATNGWEVRVAVGGATINTVSETFTVQFDDWYALENGEAAEFGTPSANPNYTAVIPAGAVASVEPFFVHGLTRHEGITIGTPLESKDAGVAGAEFSPDDIEWLLPIDIVVEDYFQELNPGVSETDLVLYYYDGTDWLSAPTTVDTVQQRITASVPVLKKVVLVDGSK